jgi:hypothetical protein
MRWIWDSIRWRPIAALHIAWWLCNGATKDSMAEFSRWAVMKMAWRAWRATVMMPHERHKYIPIEEFLDRLQNDDIVD